MFCFVFFFLSLLLFINDCEIQVCYIQIMSIPFECEYVYLYTNIFNIIFITEAKILSLLTFWSRVYIIHIYTIKITNKKKIEKKNITRKRPTKPYKRSNDGHKKAKKYIHHSFHQVYMNIMVLHNGRHFHNISKRKKKRFYKHTFIYQINKNFVSFWYFSQKKENEEKY